MSELERILSKESKEVNDLIEKCANQTNGGTSLELFILPLAREITELRLKIEALEATKISGDARIGQQPQG